MVDNSYQIGPYVGFVIDYFFSFQIFHYVVWIKAMCNILKPNHTKKYILIPMDDVRIRKYTDLHSKTKRLECDSLVWHNG